MDKLTDEQLAKVAAKVRKITATRTTKQLPDSGSRADSTQGADSKGEDLNDNKQTNPVTIVITAQ